MCSVLWLFSCPDTNTPCPLQHWWKWWYLPLPAAWLTSRVNGGTHDPEKLPPVPPSQPSPIRSVWSVRPIQLVASQFILFYQPAHKKPISPSETEQTDTIHLLHLNSQLANHNLESCYRLYLCSTLVPPILSSEGNPNKPPRMQPFPQKPISPRESHIFRTIHTNPYQDP